MFSIEYGAYESSKPQEPSSREAPISSTKPRPERCDVHPGWRVEVWGLELVWSLELGIWSFPAEPFHRGSWLTALSSFPHLVPIPTLCTVWNNFPSVLILGAMIISVS